MAASNWNRNRYWKEKQKENLTQEISEETKYRARSPTLIIPSKVPCSTIRNQSTPTAVDHGAITVARAPPFRHKAIIRQQYFSSLSTRGPPMAEPMKYPTLRPETATATLSQSAFVRIFRSISVGPVISRNKPYNEVFRQYIIQMHQYTYNEEQPVRIERSSSRRPNGPPRSGIDDGKKIWIQLNRLFSAHLSTKCLYELL